MLRETDNTVDVVKIRRKAEVMIDIKQSTLLISNSIRMLNNAHDSLQ